MPSQECGISACVVETWSVEEGMWEKVSDPAVAADLALGPTAENNSGKITHSMKDTGGK